jgi:hypothetical protein
MVDPILHTLIMVHNIEAQIILPTNKAPFGVRVHIAALAVHGTGLSLRCARQM